MVLRVQRFTPSTKTLSSWGTRRLVDRETEPTSCQLGCYINPIRRRQKMQRSWVVRRLRYQIDDKKGQLHFKSQNIHINLDFKFQILRSDLVSEAKVYDISFMLANNSSWPSLTPGLYLDCIPLVLLVYTYAIWGIFFFLFFFIFRFFNCPLICQGLYSIYLSITPYL